MHRRDGPHAQRDCLRRSRYSPGDVKKRCPCACRKPTVERVNKNAVGIIWIHRDTLVVPVLWIVAGITAGVSAHTVSERAALGAGHKTPGVTAIGARPDA